MARPIDWSPLAEADPVPGDPGEVAELARRYRDTATAISTAARKLRSIASADGWVGKAAIEFRDQAQSVAGSIERAHDRYSETGHALEAYHPDQDEAQRLSGRALTKARTAESEERTAQRLYDNEEAKSEPDESLLATYRRRVQAAQRDLTDARAQLDCAVTTYTTAADRAASRIHDVSQHDGLRTNWRDRWVSILKAVANIASIIAAVAGILSLAFGWIPVIGQALAAIALIFSVISLLANLTLLLMGEGSWTDVILDAIGVATFGIGRLFTSAAKLSAKSAQLGRAWGRARPLAGQGRIATWLTGRLPTTGQSLPIFGGTTPTVLRGSFGGTLADIKNLKNVRTVWAGRHAFPTVRAPASGAAAKFHKFVGDADLAADLSAIRAMVNPRPVAFANRALIQSWVAVPAIVEGSVLDIYQFDRNVTGLAPWTK